MKFSPRDNLGTRSHPMATETEATSNPSDSMIIDNEPKRTKLDPAIDPANGSTRRSRGQFYVETPVFSSVDWKSIDFILITNYKNMLALPYITEYSEFRGKVYATEPTDLYGVEVTAHSAGYCLGSANWSIICDTEKVTIDLCESHSEDDVRLESILPMLRDIGNYADMFDRNLLYYAARADSSLQEIYKEPCVVFAGHSSLRSGAVINFIKKWGNNPNNAIIFIESEFNFKEAISAFDGLQIKTMHFPIDIRLTVEQAVEMIKGLKPREVLFPHGIVKNADDIRRQIPSLVTLYEHLDIVNVSINSQYKRTYMAENLASEIYTTNIGETKVAALYANLKTYNNQSSLIPSASSQILKQTYVIGNINVPSLIDKLTEQLNDIKTGTCTIHIDSPKVVINLDGNNIKIETKDNYTRKLVSDVLNQLLIAF
ncbi:1728_t:CDS:2 [Racocetra fulgida]|uniref:1728_t:CDS:1 n=1 Tax=Racocetra fulgida TaxID=60492 RepID=A0A9N9CTH5_9GLOM|nr:1728_t:CDS:2 [Racocetra fulgida]